MGHNDDDRRPDDMGEGDETTGGGTLDGAAMGPAPERTGAEGAEGARLVGDEADGLPEILAEPTITFFDDAAGNEAAQAPSRVSGSDAAASGEGLAVKGPSHRSHNKAIALIALLVVAVVVGVFGFNAYRQQMSEAAAAAYSDDVRSVVALMNGGESEANKVCEKIRRIWRSAIFTKSKYLWDADIRQYYSTNFNTAVAMYFMSSEYQASKAVLEGQPVDVKEGMQKVADPPEGFEGAYEALTDLYADFNTVIGLATDPTGNITSYTEACNEAFGDYRDDSNLVESRIPSRYQWDQE